MNRPRLQRVLAAAGLSLVTGTAAVGLAVAGVGPLGEVAASVRAVGDSVSRGVLSVVMPVPAPEPVQGEDPAPAADEDARPADPARDEAPATVAADGWAAPGRLDASEEQAPEDDGSADAALTDLVDPGGARAASGVEDAGAPDDGGLGETLEEPADVEALVGGEGAPSVDIGSAVSAVEALR